MVDLLAADWNHWPDGLSPSEIAETAGSLGVAGLELGVYATRDELSPARLEEWRRLGDRHRVSVRMLLYSMPADRWPDGGLGSTSALRRLLGEVEALLGIASRLGLDTVGLWPGADPPGADHMVMVRAISELAALAAGHGVRIAVEPKPGTAVAAPADVVALSNETASPDHIGLLLDTGHEHAAGRDPAALVPLVANHLFHVHLGDSDGDPDADLPPGRLHPLDPFLAALDAAGYTGAMSPDAYGAVAAGVVTGAEALEETVQRVSAYQARQPG